MAYAKHFRELSEKDSDLNEVDGKYKGFLRERCVPPTAL